MDKDLILRLFTSFICGTLFSISGSLIQIVTQNDLAGPSTLGFEAFVVVIILVAHAIGATLFGLNISLFALILFFITILPLFIFRNKMSYFFHQKNILLIGLCFNLLVGAIFSFIQFLFLTSNRDFPSELWFGNFKEIGNESFTVLLIIFGCAFGFIFSHLKKLKILSFGEQFASNLNIDSSKLFFSAWLMSLIMTGAITVYFGVFSFLSLIFPHFLRSFSFFRSDLKHELVYGSLLCGLILCFIDQICMHWLYYNSEIPAGMVTSIIGSFGLVLILLSKNLRGEK